ncbi:hypothetical protein HUX88_24870 [Duganella sp. BJB1802]|uniref:hypothetical protein n=1 Tax=unclassified Duganella TaxID=2636909 RepID=UPI0011C12AA4|nr:MULTISPECIES: hypothetical protein [unclassified Duganella]NVD73743.1 hypothetical protein [Duganella sp. BJB1802]
METLARVLILATKYVGDLACDDAFDDDIAVLESISDELKKCTMDEKSCLVRVSKELGFPSWPDEMGIV